MLAEAALGQSRGQTTLHHGAGASARGQGSGVLVLASQRWLLLGVAFDQSLLLLLRLLWMHFILSLVRFVQLLLLLRRLLLLLLGSGSGGRLLLAAGVDIWC